MGENVLFEQRERVHETSERGHAADLKSKIGQLAPTTPDVVHLEKPIEIGEQFGQNREHREHGLEVVADENAHGGRDERVSQKTRRVDELGQTSRGLERVQERFDLEELKHVRARVRVESARVEDEETSQIEHDTRESNQRRNIQ